MSRERSGAWATAAVVSAVILFCGLGPPARADVKLPKVLGDHMVLQRGRPVRVWGWADPGEKVTVSLGAHKAAATAGEDGAWAVTLPAMKAGGPHEMTVAGNNTLVLRDILIGEVWVCSGQSNMEWRLVASRGGYEAIRTADYPRIRLFHLPRLFSDEPVADVKTSWRVCSPKTVSWFSGVGYFFGRELHKELDVPVGLMMSAVGGTRIEPWTPAVGVKSVPELAGKDKPVDGKLYNGMIHPLVPMAIRGVIWYQGEGNLDDGWIYYHRMRALINGWRTAWGQGDFPFYYVQLAPLNWGPSARPGTALPKIWEAQTAALRVPNTGMVVTNDIGNTGRAHPRNKQDVGKRLALWALAKTYGKKDVIYSGPLYKAMKVEGSAIRITFRHAHGGLASRDGKALTWFTIAGADKRFVPAKAEIDGKSVVVSSDAVKEPVAVRFGWHQIAEPNLMNKAGLPASTFRTDTW